MSARETIRNVLLVHYADSPNPELVADTLMANDRAETLAEVTAWLIKKAREFHASSRKQERAQGDTCAVLASKIARGAVRPDNLRMLPNAGFFEVDRTYVREHHGEKIEFRVSAVDVAPDGAERIAFGWRRRAGQAWEPTNADDMTGWAEVAEDGDGR